MGNKRKSETQNLVFAAIFTALIAVFAQIPPTTHEFPITLQTLAIALCGYTLSVRYSLFSIVSYVLLGLVGAPVFSGFCGGYHHLIGPAGGFIIAFPILVFFCALSQKLKPVIFKILFGVCGMVLTYVLGIIYFSLVTKTPLWSAVLMYVPLFLKDVLSLVLAFYISKLIRKRINKKSA